MTQPTLDQLVREYLDADDAEEAAFQVENKLGEWEEWTAADQRLRIATKALLEHGRRALLATPSAKLVEACRMLLDELNTQYVDGEGDVPLWTLIFPPMKKAEQALADYDQDQLNPYNPSVQRSVTQPGDIEHHQRGLTNPQE